MRGYYFSNRRWNNKVSQSNNNVDQSIFNIKERSIICFDNNNQIVIVKNALQNSYFAYDFNFFVDFCHFVFLNNVALLKKRTSTVYLLPDTVSSIEII